MGSTRCWKKIPGAERKIPLDTERKIPHDAEKNSRMLKKIPGDVGMANPSGRGYIHTHTHTHSQIHTHKHAHMLTHKKI